MCLRKFFLLSTAFKIFNIRKRNSKTPRVYSFFCGPLTFVRITYHANLALTNIREWLYPSDVHVVNKCLEKNNFYVECSLEA